MYVRLRKLSSERKRVEGDEGEMEVREGMEVEVEEWRESTTLSVSPLASSGPNAKIKA